MRSYLYRHYLKIDGKCHGQSLLPIVERFSRKHSGQQNPPVGSGQEALLKLAKPQRN